MRPNFSLLRSWLHNRGLLVAIFFCVILLSTSNFSFAQVQPAKSAPAAGSTQANQVSLTGTFYFISGGTDPYYYLYDDQGQNYELRIDRKVMDAAGGSTLLNRTRVQIGGGDLGLSRTLDGGRVIEVTSITPAGQPGKSGITKNAITGHRPFVTILCRFADSTGVTPQPVSYFTDLMSNTKPGLDNYFREASYGAVDLVGSQVVGWFNLPQPRAYYFTSDPPNFQKLANDCSALADATINFNNFQGINFVFNVNFGCCAWGGAIGMTLDGTKKFWPATWMPPNGLTQSVFAHEMGHAFGMPHSANVLGTTYQNAWDVMSQDRFNCAAATDPTFGCTGQQSIAYYKLIPGWISDSRIFTPTKAAGPVQISLERVAQPGPGNYLMAKIPLNDGTDRFYTVEARQRVGYDSKLANDAVIIHLVDTSRTDPAWIVDADNNSNSSNAGAQWTVGETFTDAQNKISVKVDSAYSTGFVVTITNSLPTELSINASAVSNSVSGTDDINWYTLTVPVASTYNVETTTTTGPADEQTSIYGPGNGTQLVYSNAANGSGNDMAKSTGQYLDVGTYYVSVKAKSASSTGKYSIKVTAPLVVTKSTNVPTEVGSLAYAIDQAQTGDTIYLLPSNNTINLNKTLTISRNITIQGSCKNGPDVTIDGSSATAQADGLVLNSKVNLSGVKITGFSGTQLKVGASGSQLRCVKVTAKVPVA